MKPPENRRLSPGTALSDPWREGPPDEDRLPAARGDLPFGQQLPGSRPSVERQGDR